MWPFGPRKIRALEDRYLTQFVDDVIALAQLTEKHFEDVDRERKKIGSYSHIGQERKQTSYRDLDKKRIGVRVEFFHNVIARAQARMEDAETGKFDAGPGAD